MNADSVGLINNFPLTHLVIEQKVDKSLIICVHLRSSAVLFSFLGNFFRPKFVFDIEPPVIRRHAARMEMEERDLGIQPLDGIMQRWGVTNHDLVEDSPEQLTHKQIQRAKAGRRLTLKMMMKVARSLNIAVWNRLSKANKETFVEYLHKDIFSYSKDYNPDKADPNEAMIQALAKIKK